MTNAGKIIYHITTQDSWKDALQKGYYQAASLVTEGFIHCSEESQVAGVLQRYFKGMNSLIRLYIDTGKLRSELRYDLSPSTNEFFPHVYGSINLDAVIKVETMASQR